MAQQSFLSVVRMHSPALLMVMVLVAGIHGLVVARAEVASRDSIGFIRYALHLESPPPNWSDSVQPGRLLSRLEVVQRAEHPPGYPLAVLVVSGPVRWCMGGVSCDAMVLACQLASSLAAVLLVLPLYCLGVWLHGRAVGLSAGLIFSCLPVAAHVTSDGLADGLYLLWLVSGLAGCVWALAAASRWGMGLAGLATGLAYWTRPEALMLPVAVLLVLTSLAVRRTWPVRRALVLAVVYLAATLAVCGPYILLIGGLTNKPTPRGLLDGQPPTIPGHTHTPCDAGGSLAVGGPLNVGGPLAISGPLAAWFRERDTLTVCLKLSSELLKTTNYVLLPLGLLGLWLARRRLAEPGGALLVVLGGLNLALLWRMASVMGYASERHFLLVTLLLTLAGMVALARLADWFGTRWAWVGTRWVWVGLVAGLVLLGVPSLVKPMHANRAGHHAAGVWLAANAPHDAVIYDPFCWSHFYAGRVFREDEPPPTNPPRLTYLILEQSSNQHSRLPMLPIAREVARHGQVVYHWPPHRSVEQAMVVVVRVEH